MHFHGHSTVSISGQGLCRFQRKTRPRGRLPCHSSDGKRSDLRLDGGRQRWFATVSGTPGGTGNGSLTYSIPTNTTNVARTTTLNIAGTAITLTQDATASLFTDVLPNDPVNAGFFDGINLMYTNNISKGTKASPLTYSPNLNVTRDQMAVFIVRTILGGGPNVDNFDYSPTPYFTDVPPTYQFFKWIQKLRDLGVTAGTTSTTYGPALVVTRDQMAVFIVRARLGSCNRIQSAHGAAV